MGLFGFSSNADTASPVPAGPPVETPPDNPAPGGDGGPPRLPVDQTLPSVGNGNPASPDAALGGDGYPALPTPMAWPSSDGGGDGALPPSPSFAAVSADPGVPVMDSDATQAAGDGGYSDPESLDAAATAALQADDDVGNTGDDGNADSPIPSTLAQIQPPDAPAQPPRLGSAGRVNRAGTSPAPPVKTAPSSPATAAGKGPPRVPDYSHFSQFYAGWSKSHGGAPPYVPASAWKPIPPDPTKLDLESKSGPYNRITFHDTGSDVTPQAVDALHTGHEPFLHYLERQASEGFKAEQYHFGDVGYHFMIGQDGTIYEGRPLSYEGAHVYGQNPANIGVAFLGDYRSKGFSDAQVNSAKTLIRVLNQAYGIGQGAKGQPYIFTHTDLAPTGRYARPFEFVGKANQQMNQIKAWSQTRGPGN
jgi:hypothetical protein